MRLVQLHCIASYCRALLAPLPSLPPHDITNVTCTGAALTYLIVDVLVERSLIVTPEAIRPLRFSTAEGGGQVCYADKCAASAQQLSRFLFEQIIFIESINNLTINKEQYKFGQT